MVRLASYLAAGLAMGLPVAAVCAEAPRTLRISSVAEYQAVAGSLRAGDTVILKNGVWRDFDLGVAGEGRADAPIRLRAETPGGVILSGQSRLRLGGRYIEVSGLIFRDGYAPKDEVVAFRVGDRVATHSRVSDTVIDGFNRPNPTGNDSWVALFGSDNRFDHNHIVGKTTPGVTLAVRLENEADRPNRHRIDHNYFGPRAPLGANGGETIRIGTSHNSLSDSNTLVEANLFEDCSGEVEIISVKSGGNVVRGNLFLRSQGAVTLRHGNGNTVERNIFMGGGAAGTGGVRVINAGQTVRNNLFIGLSGTGFVSALTVMNGVPNSPLNRYNQVRNADIHNNTFIDAARLTFGAGADAERTLPPVDSRFRDNLIIGTATRLDTLSDTSGMAFSGNLISRGATPRHDGFTAADVSAIVSGEGKVRITAPEGVGAPRDLIPLSRAEVGVSWYSQAGVADATAARAIEVAGAKALTEAVTQTVGPLHIRLKPGRYDLGRLSVRHPLYLSGAATLEGGFRLSEAGDLTLEGLTLSGASAIVATPSKTGHGYVVRLKSVSVTGLAGPLISAEPGGFYRDIRIEDSGFTAAPAAVIDLAGPLALKGAYAADAVSISGSRFQAVGALNLVRGGKDESTSGPRVILSDNRFEGVAQPAYLHGATQLRLEDNRFIDSGPVRLIRENGTADVTIGTQAVSASRADLHFEYTRPN